jgi:hypothetical protein
MSDTIRLQAKVRIDYQGRIESVTIHDGKDCCNGGLILFVGRDGIEIEDVRDRIKGEDDE